MEINYMKVNCPELEITPVVKETAIKIAKWREEREDRFHDCMAIAAPMLGLPVRLAVIDSLLFGKAVITANLFIVGTEGDSFEYLATLLTHPKQYVRFQVHPKVTVAFDDVETGEMVTKDITGKEAYVWEVMNEILEGRVLDSVPRDFRTIRNTEKIKPNQTCTCGSGRKYKKCCGLNTTTLL